METPLISESICCSPPYRTKPLSGLYPEAGDNVGLAVSNQSDMRLGTPWCDKNCPKHGAPVPDSVHSPFKLYRCDMKSPFLVAPIFIRYLKAMIASAVRRPVHCHLLLKHYTIEQNHIVLFAQWSIKLFKLSALCFIEQQITCFFAQWSY